MLKPLKHGPFLCINCGFPGNKSLIKIFGKSKSNQIGNLQDSRTNIKLSECKMCHKMVDDYIQLDNCILILNAILQKKSFYRHIIHNCEINLDVPFKLFVFFTLCDAYRQWSLFTLENLTFSDMESAFYRSFFYSFASNLFFYLLVYLILKGVVHSIGFKKLIVSLIICSYGKLFKIPSTLWPLEYQILTDLFIEINNLCSFIHCCTVVSLDKITRFKALIVLLVVYFIKFIVINYIILI